MVREPSNTPHPQHPASHPASLNISGPSIDRSNILRTPEVTREIEAKYFIPNEVLSPVIKGRSYIQIEQRYFPSDRVRAIVEEFKTELNISDPEAFSSARIRRSRSPHGALIFHLESKGKKQGKDDVRISRREATATISAATYKKLKDEATAGTLRKRRYTIHGAIETEHGKIPVIAHVDVLQAAGKKIRKLKNAPSTVDIELTSAAHIRHLRAGRHSFSFLAKCIELTARAPSEQKILATRLLAKQGIGEEQSRLLKKLAREAQELRTKHG